jgi:hypothetical protein
LLGRLGPGGPSCRGPASPPKPRRRPQEQLRCQPARGPPGAVGARRPAPGRDYRRAAERLGPVELKGGAATRSRSAARPRRLLPGHAGPTPARGRVRRPVARGPAPSPCRCPRAGGRARKHRRGAQLGGGGGAALSDSRRSRQGGSHEAADRLVIVIGRLKCSRVLLCLGGSGRHSGWPGAPWSPGLPGTVPRSLGLFSESRAGRFRVRKRETRRAKGP